MSPPSLREEVAALPPPPPLELAEVTVLVDPDEDAVMVKTGDLPVAKGPPVALAAGVVTVAEPSGEPPMTLTTASGTVYPYEAARTELAESKSAAWSSAVKEDDQESEEALKTYTPGESQVVTVVLKPPRRISWPSRRLHVWPARAKGMVLPL